MRTGQRSSRDAACHHRLAVTADSAAPFVFAVGCWLFLLLLLLLARPRRRVVDDGEDDGTTRLAVVSAGPWGWG